MVVGAAGGGLEVRDEGLGPLERRQLAGLTWAGDDRAVGCHVAAGQVGSCPAVGDQMHIGRQRRLRASREPAS
jgi:hypothetical protein